MEYQHRYVNKNKPKTTGEVRNKIETLHNIIFPLQEFNHDYIKACSNIHKEIKSMVLSKNKNLRPTILIIGRFVGIEPGKLEYLFEYNFSELYREIQDKATDLCLSLEEYEKSAYVMSKADLKLVDNKLLCEHYAEWIAAYDYVVQDLYYPGRLNYEPYGDKINQIDGILFEFVRRKIYEETQTDYQIAHEKLEQFKDILESMPDMNEDGKNFVLNLINFEITTEDVGQYYDEFRSNLKSYRKLTQQEKNFIVTLHNKMRDGKIPLNIMTYGSCYSF